MKRVTFVLFMAVSLVPSLEARQDSSASRKSSAGVFVGHEEWLACQSNDQCVIARVEACGFMFAVNKDYSEEASKFASKNISCRKPFFYFANTVAECRKNECVLVVPGNDNGVAKE